MEIERKFLVRDLEQAIQAADRKIVITQVYIAHTPLATVRLRITDDAAYLTLKSRATHGGLQREEWEYQIPLSEAKKMLQIAQPGGIRKVRYCVPYQGFTWEVDVFEDDLEGVVVAEVELQNLNDNPPLPQWIGREVTGDKRYNNSYLSAYRQRPPQE